MIFYDSAICFVNCHLPAGQKKCEARLAAFDYIHEKAMGNVWDYSWIIFTGDTNFRVSLPYNSVLEYVQKYRQAESEHGSAEVSGTLLHQMVSADQLQCEKHKSAFLKKYQEQKIGFLPSYKFDIGSDTYDTSKKQRVPSW